MRRLLISVGCSLAIGSALLVASAQADFPYGSGPGFKPNDPTTYRIVQGTPAPNDLGGNDWKYAATPEPGNEPVNHEPWELNGVRGASVFDPSPTVNTAWAVTTGRPDVSIAEFDSGVEWNDPGLVIDLRYKTRLNKGELPVPNHNGADLIPTDPSINCATYASAYDANGDGIFNLKDYACDSRINLADPRRAGPAGMFTPEDIIIAFSNGNDADGNGYVDDIAGWDFLDNDNDPFDDVQYGHGSGEARGGAGEVNNGGNSSPCPNCMITPFRVGDSFIADANRFAQAAIYAVDNNFQIIQEALGTLNNTPLARKAVAYAYKHGVPVIASAADEAAQHHNYVSSLPDTIVVNSVNKYPTQDANAPDESPFKGFGFTLPEENPKSYLTFNGCTNFSSKVTLSIPSSSCSSNATEVAGGIAGLVYSAALNARDAGKLAPNPDCHLVTGAQCPITANEMRQLMASGSFGTQSQVDDVNFTTSAANPATPEPSCSPTPSPGCTDPNGALQTDVNGVRPIASPPDSRSYPARKGPDQFYGYGRVNAYRAAEEASLGNVPPEAEITSPDWFAQVDPTQANAAVAGHVWARGQTYTCAVFVAPGSYPNNDPKPAGDMEQLGAGQIPAGGCDGTTHHTGAIDGTLASINIAHLKTRFPPDATTSNFRGRETGDGAGQTSNGRPNSEPYGFTVRVVATTVPPVGGTVATGEDRRQLYLHRDQDLLNGFPRKLAGDGESSPAFADLNGDNKNELIFGTAAGLIHALRPDGSELPGWPVHTDPLPLHQGHAFTSGEIGKPVYGAMLASIAVGDLNRDGSPEVVAADFEGKLYAWSATGKLLWRREANPNYSGKPLKPFVNVRKGHFNRTQHGFLGSPVLANLDGTKGGKLDVIAANMDRHVYAFHADGSPVPGYPVLVVDHSKVASIDPTTHRVNFDTSKTGSSNDDLETDQGAIIDTPAVGNITGDAKPEIVVGTNEEYRAGDGNEPGPNTSTSLSVTALGQTGILSNANGRLFALKSTGDADGNPNTSDWSVGAHWPVKMAILNANLLPVVGEGVTGAPAIGPASMSCPSGGSGPKVGASPNNGLGYVLNGDGSSCYGQDSSGRYGTLQSENGSGAGQTDRPNFPAVGHPAFGNFGGGPSVLMPTTGILRALDVVFPEYQTGSQDSIGVWDPTTSSFRPGFPARMNDLQFLTGPSVADIDGQPGEELIAGSAYLDLQAYNGQGTPVSSAWPKLTSGWMVANPLIGSFGTTDTSPSAHKTIVAMTRDGIVFAYKTAAPACSPSSWPRFHHDLANSGTYDRDAIDPGTPGAVSYKDGKLTFTAPGDDLLCGTADHYEIVESASPLTGATFDQGLPVPVASKPKPAGQQETVVLGGKLQRYLLVRAVDDQGNVGPAVRVDTAPGGAGNPACVDRQRPQSTVDLSSLTNRPHGLTVTGHTNDNGCRDAAVAKKRNAIAVSVSIARRIGPRARERCQFLERNFKFSATRDCARHTMLRAIGTYSLAKHRIDWRLPTGVKLSPGHYVATARGVDQSGNVERLLTKRNHPDFTIR